MTTTSFNEATAAPSVEQPAIVWLNMSGDVTITWDESNRAAVQALVEQKMAEGYSFFILEPRTLKFLGNRKVALKNASQLDGAKGVVVPDAVVSSLVDRLGDPEVQRLVNDKKVQLSKAVKSDLKTARRAQSASEVLASQSVAIRPIVGG